LIPLKGHPLPKLFHKQLFHERDVITHINGIPLDINASDPRIKNVQKFKDLTKGPIGNVIEFAVTNNRAGTIPNYRKVYIELGQALNKQGGRKTTYRHKKHLTSRNSKKNNKKRKVMVGGVRVDKLDGPQQPPPPPNLFTPELRSRYPQSASASASLPRHQPGTLPPSSLVYSRTQQGISDDVDDVDDDDADAGAAAAEINQHPPVKQTTKKSNKRRLICECTKGYKPVKTNKVTPLNAADV
jgi:hypothetical protein